MSYYTHPEAALMHAPVDNHFAHHPNDPAFPAVIDPAALAYGQQYGYPPPPQYSDVYPPYDDHAAAAAAMAGVAPPLPYTMGAGYEHVLPSKRLPGGSKKGRKKRGRTESATALPSPVAYAAPPLAPPGHLPVVHASYDMQGNDPDDVSKTMTNAKDQGVDKTPRGPSGKPPTESSSVPGLSVGDVRKCLNQIRKAHTTIRPNSLLWNNWSAGTFALAYLIGNHRTRLSRQDKKNGATGGDDGCDEGFPANAPGGSGNAPGPPGDAPDGSEDGSEDTGSSGGTPGRVPE